MGLPRGGFGIQHCTHARAMTTWNHAVRQSPPRLYCSQHNRQLASPSGARHHASHGLRCRTVQYVCNTVIQRAPPAHHHHHHTHGLVPHTPVLACHRRRHCRCHHPAMCCIWCRCHPVCDQGQGRPPRDRQLHQAQHHHPGQARRQAKAAPGHRRGFGTTCRLCFCPSPDPRATHDHGRQGRLHPHSPTLLTLPKHTRWGRTNMHPRPPPPKKPSLDPPSLPATPHPTPRRPSTTLRRTRGAASPRSWPTRWCRSPAAAASSTSRSSTLTSSGSSRTSSCRWAGRRGGEGRGRDGDGRAVQEAWRWYAGRHGGHAEPASKMPLFGKAGCLAAVWSTARGIATTACCPAHDPPRPRGSPLPKNPNQP